MKVKISNALTKDDAPDNVKRELKFIRRLMSSRNIFTLVKGDVINTYKIIDISTGFYSRNYYHISRFKIISQ